MKMLCWLGMHLWQPDDVWASRACRLCQHVEVRYYTRERGMYWERIT
mgnify:FL=1|jgi:hypothetical protein